MNAAPQKIGKLRKIGQDKQGLGMPEAGNSRESPRRPVARATQKPDGAAALRFPVTGAEATAIRGSGGLDRVRSGSAGLGHPDPIEYRGEAFLNTASGFLGGDLLEARRLMEKLGDQRFVVGRSPAVRRVAQDRLAGAGSLGQPNAAMDDRIENEVTEDLSHLLLDLAAERRPLVDEGQKQTDVLY